MLHQLFPVCFQNCAIIVIQWYQNDILCISNIKSKAVFTIYLFKATFTATRNIKYLKSAGVFSRQTKKRHVYTSGLCITYWYENCNLFYYSFLDAVKCIKIRRLSLYCQQHYNWLALTFVHMHAAPAYDIATVTYTLSPLCMVREVFLTSE